MLGLQSEALLCQEGSGRDNQPVRVTGRPVLPSQTRGVISLGNTSAVLQDVLGLSDAA